MYNEPVQIALLIPLFEPSEKTLAFLSSFQEGDFDLFVLVNDGSSKDYDPLFEAIGSSTPFQIVSYSNNKGKGHALKHGLSYIKDNHPEILSVVTADGDGQHSLKDVKRVRDASKEHPLDLILGVRDLASGSIPKNSKIGNDISNFYYSMLTRTSIMDTQTGLRAIPKNLFGLALSVYGERYDYELSFLLEASEETKIWEVEIETIYENGKNEGTHFRPLKDTLRIYRVPLLFIAISLTSLAVDSAAFYFLFKYAFSAFSMTVGILLSTISAHVASALVGFPLTFGLVYNNRQKKLERSLVYVLRLLIDIAISFGLVIAFSALAGTSDPSSVTIIHFLCGLLVFLLGLGIYWLLVPSLRKIRS